MQNISEISAIFREDKAPISANFVCITFPQYGVHHHPHPPATLLAMAGFRFKRMQKPCCFKINKFSCSCDLYNSTVA